MLLRHRNAWHTPSHLIVNTKNFIGLAAVLAILTIVGSGCEDTTPLPLATEGIPAVSPTATTSVDPTSTPSPTATPPIDPTSTPSPTATSPVDPPAIATRLTLQLGDGESTTSAISASWEVEDGTDVTRYEVAIGSVMGGSDILDWHDVGLTTAYHAQDGQDGVNLALDKNRDYYLTVRAVNAGGTVLGLERSGAWYVYEPYTFDAARYPSIMLEAPNSFWDEDKKPDSYEWLRLHGGNWDGAYESYLLGSARIDLYHNLGERVLIGSPKVTIFQTENGFPTRSNVIRIGPPTPDDEYAVGHERHANDIASMLYDCDELRDLPWTTPQYNYYEGCQTNPRKYAMTSTELKERLTDFNLTPETAGSFENTIFSEMGAPQVWSAAHSQPTDVDFNDPALGLRLGDWMFARYNILAVTPQPGSWASHENPGLSGNYYNSLVVGSTSFNYSYAAQSSIDNMGGSRHKPDIVVFPSNLSTASSWSVATMAAAASAMLGLSYTESLLSGSAYAEAMRAIILAGAGKDGLCPESIVESEGLCHVLPSASEQWQWSNTETAPLDPVYGAGFFNYRNSFDILTAGRSGGGADSGETGWDTRFLAEGQSASYTFTAVDTHDSFSLALTWHRDITPNDDGSLSADLPDFQVELLDRDGTPVARSDDPHNNIEHIYVPEGLQRGQQYTIKVTLTSAENPTRYGLAWQTRVNATQNSPWRH